MKFYLSVIIPTYSGRTLLSLSVPAVLIAIKNIRNEIIVVNDGQSSSVGIKEQYPSVNVYETQKLGFTGAVNHGVIHSKGDMLLILNDDCVVEPCCISEMLLNMKENNLHATQPIIYRGKQNNTVSNKIKKLSAIDTAGFYIDFSYARAHTFKSIEKAKAAFAQKNNEGEMKKNLGLSATCLLIRKKTLENEGGFDEFFHSYLEDVDLFLSLSKKQIPFAPTLSACAIHLHRATSSKMGCYKERCDLINWIRIIRKHYALSMVLRYAPSLLLERLRNINGLIKCMIYNTFGKHVK